MTMNVLNNCTWAGIYGSGFIGTAKVFSGAYEAVKATFNWGSKTITERKIQDLPRAAYEQSLNQVKDGAVWVAAALVVKQLVSHFWSPVPAEGVLKALSVFGWSPARSPLIDAVADKIGTFVGLKVTLY
jgi:hypothetical protein